MDAYLALCVIAYVITLPLWLPPVMIAKRSVAIPDLARKLAIWLAVLSPGVATIGFAIGNAYCRRGSTAMGFTSGWWPQCHDTEAAWAVMLAPATLMGIMAWWLALDRGPRLGDD